MSIQSPPFYESLAIIIIVLNSISLISLLFVIGIYIYNWKNISSFPMRLSFYLCIACLGQNLYVILFNPITIHNIQLMHQQTSPYCKLQAVLKVWFDLSSILCTFLIIYSVYASIVLKRSLQSRQIIFILISFVLPFIASLMQIIYIFSPIFFDQYGFISYFCWFNSNQYNGQLAFWLKMSYFYIPLWIMFVINLTLSIITYFSLKKLQLQQRLLTIFKRILLFPFIMFVTGFFSTCDLIYTQVVGKTLPWLNFLGLILLSLYGFFNSIAYGFNPLIRDKIVKFFKGNLQQSTVQSNNQQVQSRSNSVDSRTSRNTQRIQQQLFQYRTNRALSQPIVKEKL